MDFYIHRDRHNQEIEADKKLQEQDMLQITDEMQADLSHMRVNQERQAGGRVYHEKDKKIMEQFPGEDREQIEKLVGDMKIGTQIDRPAEPLAAMDRSKMNKDEQKRYDKYVDAGKKYQDQVRKVAAMRESPCRQKQWFQENVKLIHLKRDMTIQQYKIRTGNMDSELENRILFNTQMQIAEFYKNPGRISASAKGKRIQGQLEREALRVAEAAKLKWMRERIKKEAPLRVGMAARQVQASRVLDYAKEKEMLDNQIREQMMLSDSNAGPEQMADLTYYRGAFCEGKKDGETRGEFVKSLENTNRLYSPERSKRMRSVQYLTRRLVGQFAVKKEMCSTEYVRMHLKEAAGFCDFYDAFQRLRVTHQDCIAMLPLDLAVQVSEQQALQEAYYFHAKNVALETGTDLSDKQKNQAHSILEQTKREAAVQKSGTLLNSKWMETEGRKNMTLSQKLADRDVVLHASVINETEKQIQAVAEKRGQYLKDKNLVYGLFRGSRLDYRNRPISFDEAVLQKQEKDAVAVLYGKEASDPAFREQLDALTERFMQMNLSEQSISREYIQTHPLETVEKAKFLLCYQELLNQYEKMENEKYAPKENASAFQLRQILCPYYIGKMENELCSVAPEGTLSIKNREGLSEYAVRIGEYQKIAERTEELRRTDEKAPLKHAVSYMAIRQSEHRSQGMEYLKNHPELDTGFIREYRQSVKSETCSREEVLGKIIMGLGMEHRNVTMQNAEAVREDFKTEQEYLENRAITMQNAMLQKEEQSLFGGIFGTDSTLKNQSMTALLTRYQQVLKEDTVMEKENAIPQMRKMLFLNAVQLLMDNYKNLAVDEEKNHERFTAYRDYVKSPLFKELSENFKNRRTLGKMKNELSYQSLEREMVAPEEMSAALFDKYRESFIKPVAESGEAAVLVVSKKSELYEGMQSFGKMPVMEKSSKSGSREAVLKSMLRFHGFGDKKFGALKTEEDLEKAVKGLHDRRLNSQEISGKTASAQLINLQKGLEEALKQGPVDIQVGGEHLSIIAIENGLVSYMKPVLNTAVGSASQVKKELQEENRQNLYQNEEEQEKLRVEVEKEYEKRLVKLDEKNANVAHEILEMSETRMKQEYVGAYEASFSKCYQKRVDRELETREANYVKCKEHKDASDILQGNLADFLPKMQEGKVQAVKITWISETEKALMNRKRVVKAAAFMNIAKEQAALQKEAVLLERKTELAQDKIRAAKRKQDVKADKRTFTDELKAMKKEIGQAKKNKVEYNEILTGMEETAKQEYTSRKWQMAEDKFRKSMKKEVEEAIETQAFQIGRLAELTGEGPKDAVSQRALARMRVVGAEPVIEQLRENYRKEAARRIALFRSGQAYTGTKEEQGKKVDQRIKDSAFPKEREILKDCDPYGWELPKDFEQRMQDTYWYYLEQKVEPILEELRKDIEECPYGAFEYEKKGRMDQTPESMAKREAYHKFLQEESAKIHDAGLKKEIASDLEKKVKREQEGKIRRKYYFNKQEQIDDELVKTYPNENSWVYLALRAHTKVSGAGVSNYQTDGASGISRDVESANLLIAKFGSTQGSGRAEANLQTNNTKAIHSYVIQLKNIFIRKEMFEESYVMDHISSVKSLCDLRDAYYKLADQNGEDLEKVLQENDRMGSENRRSMKESLDMLERYLAYANYVSMRYGIPLFGNDYYLKGNMNLDGTSEKKINQTMKTYQSETLGQQKIYNQRNGSLARVQRSEDVMQKRRQMDEFMKKNPKCHFKIDSVAELEKYFMMDLLKAYLAEEETKGKTENDNILILMRQYEKKEEKPAQYEERCAQAKEALLKRAGMIPMDSAHLDKDYIMKHTAEMLENARFLNALASTKGIFGREETNSVLFKKMIPYYTSAVHYYIGTFELQYSGYEKELPGKNTKEEKALKQELFSVNSSLASSHAFEKEKDEVIRKPAKSADEFKKREVEEIDSAVRFLAEEGNLNITQFGNEKTARKLIAGMGGGMVLTPKAELSKLSARRIAKEETIKNRLRHLFGTNEADRAAEAKDALEIYERLDYSKKNFKTDVEDIYKELDHFSEGEAREIRIIDAVEVLRSYAGGKYAEHMTRNMHENFHVGAVYMDARKEMTGIGDVK